MQQLRRDYRVLEEMYEARREPARILAHYELERGIADELRFSSKAQRDSGLYQDAYKRLLDGLPDHPRKTKNTPERRERSQAYVRRQAQMLAKELSADDVFVDLGAGDCDVALFVAPYVKESIGVDVNDALAPPDAGNFRFVKNGGVDIPLPDASVSFVYSNQLMERTTPLSNCAKCSAS